MNMILKIIILTLAALLISYVVVPFAIVRNADAATLEEVAGLMSAFSTMKMRVISTRKVIFWDAQANNTAHCWKFHVPSNVTTPPTGQGFYAHQWTMTASSADFTEEQCYAQP